MAVAGFMLMYHLALCAILCGHAACMRPAIEVSLIELSIAVGREFGRELMRFRHFTPWR